MGGNANTIIAAKTNDINVDDVGKKEWLAAVFNKKEYRDILEVCRQPATAFIVRASVAKKTKLPTYLWKLNRLTKIGLLERLDGRRQFGVKSYIKFVITPMGERLLKQKPGSKPLLQYITKGFDRE